VLRTLPTWLSIGKFLRNIALPAAADAMGLVQKENPDSPRRLRRKARRMGALQGILRALELARIQVRTVRSPDERLRRCDEDPALSGWRPHLPGAIVRS
jgi:ribosomal protein S14